MDQLPPQVQEQMSQLQQLQQQVQTLARQKQQLEMNENEVERALDELGGMSEDTSIYKSIGGIMAKTNHKDATEELEEKKESLNLRMQQIEKQKQRAEKKLSKLRGKVQDMLRGQQPSGEAGQ